MAEHADDSVERKYYFNVSTGKVEQGYVSGVSHRMGPYDTPEEAARALKIARERNAEWEAEEERERAWAEGEDDDGV
ncbi:MULTISPECIES: SPOR domain-containing protein [unclassified Pseudactinotalea]|uniref:SPOR domain-containing protein n=1 Tax=Micrococcales TaxID=85006 RepID=UPI003C7E940C